MASRSDSNAPVLGIDLGTTNSAAAILLNGELSEIPNALGEFLTPSVVARDPADGSILVGRTAREILSTHPDRAAAAFKREMGTGREFELDGDPFSPVELSSFVLRSIKEDAARHLGYEVNKAVITVPAYFGEEQRQATKRSGELAGLEVVRILNEPTAAAMAYGLHRRDRDGSFLVFDLGGGTFDVSVMELFEGSLEVQSTAGESRLGGEDFSRRLASAAAEKLELDFEVAEFRDPVPFSRLLRRCEIAKRKASEGADLVIETPAFPHADLAATTIRFGEEDLKTIWQGLFESLRKPCRVALRGAQLDVDDLDEVVLVGGATRMPDVRALVKELFDMEPKYDLDPDLAVARGAAVQAGLYAQDAAVEDLVVTDVLSHSLGVEVIYTIAGRLVEGNFSPVIHRNTTIPTSRSEIYATVHDGQNGINLEIFEGESRKVENCRRLGSLSVKVPKKPAGEEKVEVRFTYDLGGMLEVEATVVSTQKRSSKVFERRKDPMPEEDRKRALKRLEELKLDPGEKAINRDLLARAEALLEEVGPDDRNRLEQGILQFEAALHARTPSIIRAARRDLRRLCDAIDAGDRW